MLTPTNTGEVILPCVHHMLTSDLCFVVYAFGKEGGSGQYCPYCPMTKSQWTLSLDDQPNVDVWTADLLEEMANDNKKKAPEKLGVKPHPKIKQLSVKGIVTPLTHIGLGVDNDTIAAFENRAEARIVKVSAADQVM